MEIMGSAQGGINTQYLLWSQKEGKHPVKYSFSNYSVHALLMLIALDLVSSALSSLLKMAE